MSDDTSSYYTETDSESEYDEEEPPKLGVMGALKKHWLKVLIIAIVVIIVLVFIYFYSVRDTRQVANAYGQRTHVGPPIVGAAAAPAAPKGAKIEEITEPASTTPQSEPPSVEQQWETAAEAPKTDNFVTEPVDELESHAKMYEEMIQDLESSEKGKNVPKLESEPLN